MPIKTDSEVWQNNESGPGARERIVEFLDRNRGKAFTAMEIHRHSFDANTPDPEEDYASYSAILTQMTIHLAALSYHGEVEGKPLPNEELDDNDHEDGHTAYYTVADD